MIILLICLNNERWTFVLWEGGGSCLVCKWKSKDTRDDSESVGYMYELLGLVAAWEFSSSLNWNWT